MAVDFFFEQKEKISMITMQIGRKLKSRMLPVSTLASVECLTMPSIQVTTLKADLGCAECRKRVAYIVSKMGESVESMEVDVKEKKVTLTCRAVARRTSRNKVAVVQSFCSPHKYIK